MAYFKYSVFKLMLKQNKYNVEKLTCHKCKHVHANNLEFSNSYHYQLNLYKYIMSDDGFVLVLSTSSYVSLANPLLLVENFITGLLARWSTLT